MALVQFTCVGSAARGLGPEDAVARPGWAPFFEHGFDARALTASPGSALEILRDFGRSDAGGRFAPRVR